MDEPRWTVTAGGLAWGDESDLLAHSILPWPLPEQYRNALFPPVAVDALVAAVRDQARIPGLEADAETLRKARELAAKATNGWLFSDSVKELLNLLSPAPEGISECGCGYPDACGCDNGRNCTCGPRSPAPEGEGT